MNGLLFVTVFDESENATDLRIYASLYGDSVIPGSRTDAVYDHLNLLKTIEAGLGLSDLGRRDRTAAPITGVWR